MINFRKNFENKKVLITGHTGFKGSWLCLWLFILGAKIIGISKDIPTKPSHFSSLKLNRKVKSIKLDLNNFKQLSKVIKKHKPDFIFHLAAQAIVSKSYIYPKDTWKSNTFGTLNILESLKLLKKKVNVVLITSDKVYKNLEIKKGYKEHDIIGGEDPYSASKGATEILINSYIKSFFKKGKNISIAIARAGNVIGGGDWSEDRLVPDCIRASSKKRKVIIRNPKSTRPWQHVLESVRGYMMLAIELKKNKNLHGEAFNFGPSSKFEKNVITLVKEMKKNWKLINWEIKKNTKYNESNLLKLNSKKAKKLLKWECLLSFKETVKIVTLWYKNYYIKKNDIFLFSKQQINNYQNKILKK
tara:strand:- start:6470 stop:7543 length:1074 start_codon:yes stop_codon:yes gene_type:complete